MRGAVFHLHRLSLLRISNLQRYQDGQVDQLFLTGLLTRTW